jgi:hypothetical protein
MPLVVVKAATEEAHRKDKTSFRASVHDFPGNAKIAIQPHGVEAYRSIHRKSIGTPHRSNAIVASSQESIGMQLHTITLL